MSKQKYTRKKLLELLKDYKDKALVKEYLRSLIELEITPLEDTYVLSDLELDRLAREIIRYNLTIKSIEAATYDYNPKKYGLIIDKGYDFNMSTKHNNRIYDLLSISFGDTIDITINDRLNIREQIQRKQLEWNKLEEKYYDEYYVYFGYMDSEEDRRNIKAIKDKQKELEAQILELEYLLEVEDLSELDENIKTKLAIHPNMQELVFRDSIHEINKIRDEGKIKVFKKNITR